MDQQTSILHAYKRAREAYASVADPIILSTTFEREPDGEYPHGFSYSRSANPNREGLETILAAIEGGSEAFTFGSGSAATMALFQALDPGDHVVAPASSYYGTRVILEDIFGRWGLTSSFVDLRDPALVKAAIRPGKTKILWLETPSNPLLGVCDVGALAKLAREAGALSVLDNTVATPVLQNPLALGCDFAMHSTTKSISGHADVIGGAVVAKTPSEFTKRLRSIQTKGGAIPSPFDCWLTMRGIRTLPIRVKATSETAMQMAQFLAKHPTVEACHYPGLPQHPGHQIAAKQMHGGFGALLSFQVRGGRKEAFEVAARLRLITRATSLGGVETTIEHRASIEPPVMGTPENLLRVSVGLESAKDLLADLAQALG